MTAPAADDGDDLAGAPPLVATVRVSDPRWGHAAAVADSALRALATYGAGEAAILYTDDDELAHLNARFRGKAGATNVLSFPAHEAPFLGDIALAYGVCAKEADERAIPFAHHATHLTVHGLLHLLGYDHEAAKEREAMEGIEIAVLQRLGIANPYE